MSQSLSRRSFLKYAGSGAVSLAAALLTGVSGAALAPCYEGEPALLDGKAAVELLGYAPAPELDSTLVYLSVENLSARPLAVGASYLQSRGLDSRNALYSLGTGLTALCDGRQVRVGSFARSGLYRQAHLPRQLFADRRRIFHAEKTGRPWLYDGRGEPPPERRTFHRQEGSCSLGPKVS